MELDNLLMCTKRTVYFRTLQEFKEKDKSMFSVLSLSYYYIIKHNLTQLQLSHLCGADSSIPNLLQQQNKKHSKTELYLKRNDILKAYSTVMYVIYFST